MKRKSRRRHPLPIVRIATLTVIGLCALLFFLYISLGQSVKTKAEDRSQRYCNLHQDEEACKPTCTRCDGVVCNYHPELEPWCQDTGCTANSDCPGVGGNQCAKEGEAPNDLYGCCAGLTYEDAGPCHKIAPPPDNAVSCTSYDNGTCGHCIWHPALDCRKNIGGTQTDQAKCCQDLGCDGKGGTADKPCPEPTSIYPQGGGFDPGFCYKMSATTRQLIPGSKTQSCANTNKCDIDGGCNKDCCSSDKDCPGGGKCYNNGNGYCQTKSVCSGGTNEDNDTTVPANDGRAGNCFSMRAQVFADKEGNGYRFNTHIILSNTSPGVGKGHLWFTYDNAIEKPDMAIWPGSSDYDLAMQNIGIEGPLLSSGAKKVTYSMRIPACGGGGKNQTQSMSCLYSVVNGKPKVEGPGCECSPTTPCATEAAASPATACTAGNGDKISRDGKYHCVGAEAKAICEEGKDKAAEKACPVNNVCTTKNGVDTCVINRAESGQGSAGGSVPAPATKDIRITVYYSSGINANHIEKGGVCLFKADNTFDCQKIDPGKTEQTVTFSIDWKDRANYKSTEAYIFNQKDYVYQGQTNLDLDNQTGYAIKINSKKSGVL